MADDLPVKPAEVDAAKMRESIGARKPSERAELEELSKKYRVDKGSDKKKPSDPASNPHRLLPPVEIDLHIGELVDSVA